jgi:hypothetical protein
MTANIRCDVEFNGFTPAAPEKILEIQTSKIFLNSVVEKHFSMPHVPAFHHQQPELEIFLIWILDGTSGMEPTKCAELRKLC